MAGRITNVTAEVAGDYTFPTQTVRTSQVFVEVLGPDPTIPYVNLTAVNLEVAGDYTFPTQTVRTSQVFVEVMGRPKTIGRRTVITMTFS